MLLKNILVFDILAKAALGAALLAVPRVTLIVAGLPRGDQFLLARILGSVLLGIAGAALLQLDRHTPIGLGAHGLAAINLTCAVALISILILPNPFNALRGRLLLWALALVMVILGVSQILLPAPRG